MLFPWFEPARVVAAPGLELGADGCHGAHTGRAARKMKKGEQ